MRVLTASRKVPLDNNYPSATCGSTSTALFHTFYALYMPRDSLQLGIE